MKGQMDGWHGDEDCFSVGEIKRSIRNPDDDYDRWISERYFLHEVNQSKEKEQKDEY